MMVTASASPYMLRSWDSDCSRMDTDIPFSRKTEMYWAKDGTRAPTAKSSQSRCSGRGSTPSSRLSAYSKSSFTAWE